MPFLNDALRTLRLDHALFSLMYRRGTTPWDTGISPPELVEAVEGPNAPAPGRFLDLGCGTGTNCLYLARLGWDVTGVDFAAQAVGQANAKVAAAGTLAGAVRLYQGDVTALAALGIDGPFTLLMDLGCLHGIPQAKQARYASEVARVAAPGALYMLYAFGPRTSGLRQLGITEDGVRQLFAPAFTMERVVHGSDPRGWGSTWYWLRRV